mgnify:CR=1 FL=1
MDLKVLATVSDAVGADCESNSLLWQLFGIQQLLELAQGVAEMCSRRLAVDLVVQDANGPPRSLLLLLGEGGGRRGRLG